MNLTTEPWIPVVANDGHHNRVSLHDAFARGPEICDLAVRPHERIALMRLLLCVAQAALDGPKDYGDWLTCRNRIAPAASDYLTKWKPTFELFGDKQRFLQVADLKPVKSDDDGEGNSVSKLDLALATGNNTTLFDNAGGTDREFRLADLALMLLTYQCYSPLIGRGYIGRSPCVEGDMVHTLLKKNNLLDTLHTNLLSRSTVELWLGGNRWGKPIWELAALSISSKQYIENTTTTYLGRLVPLPRAIRLLDNFTMAIGNGVEYPEFREAAATIVIRPVKGQPQRVPLPTSIEKALWRELHSITVKRIGQNSVGGALVLQNQTGEGDFDIWVGGLATDRKAKVIDAIESTFHVPAGMLTEPCQRAYEQGVDYAEKTSWRLGAAVVTYFKELGDDIGRRDAWKRRQQIQRKSAAQFWTAVEQEVQLLLSAVEQPAESWGETDWGRAVRRAARRALDAACPRDTPRQMRAYALALQTLTRPPREDSSDKPEEDTNHE